jgi:hypothetical protein
MFVTFTCFYMTIAEKPAVYSNVTPGVAFAEVTKPVVGTAVETYLRPHWPSLKNKLHVQALLMALGELLHNG